MKLDREKSVAAAVARPDLVAGATKPLCKPGTLPDYLAGKGAIRFRLVIGRQRASEHHRHPSLSRQGTVYDREENASRKGKETPVPARYFIWKRGTSEVGVPL